MKIHVLIRDANTVVLGAEKRGFGGVVHTFSYAFEYELPLGLAVEFFNVMASREFKKMEGPE